MKINSLVPFNTLPLVSSIVFYASMSLTILDSQVSGTNVYIFNRILSSYCTPVFTTTFFHNSQDTKIAQASTNR